MEIFTNFWENMTWDEKKVYAIKLVTKRDVHRRSKGSSESSRIQYSYSYHLRIDENRYPVCQSLFLATLSLKEDTIYNWMAESDNHGIPKTATNDETAQNNIKQDARKSAIKYLNDIPKMLISVEQERQNYI